MCIGIPMQVKSCGSGYAVCEGMGMQRQVETLLTGDQPVGTWLLVFLDSAREVLSETDAQKITQAVQAVNQVMQNPHQQDNNAFDTLFADLVDREPPKPPSLIALEAENNK